jgi:hypothetical protein
MVQFVPALSAGSPFRPDGAARRNEIKDALAALVIALYAKIQENV